MKNFEFSLAMCESLAWKTRFLSCFPWNIYSLLCAFSQLFSSMTRASWDHVSCSSSSTTCTCSLVKKNLHSFVANSEEKYAHNQAWCCGIRGLVSLNLSASKLRLATKHVISKDWSQNSVRSIHASTAPEISRMHCTRVRVHTLMHAFSHSNTQCALVQHMKT